MDEITDALPSRCGCGRAYWPEATGDQCGACAAEHEQTCKACGGPFEPAECASLCSDCAAPAPDAVRVAADAVDNTDEGSPYIALEVCRALAAAGLLRTEAEAAQVAALAAVAEAARAHCRAGWQDDWDTWKALVVSIAALDAVPAAETGNRKA